MNSYRFSTPVFIVSLCVPFLACSAAESDREGTALRPKQDRNALRIVTVSTKSSADEDSLFDQHLQPVGSSLIDNSVSPQCTTIPMVQSNGLPPCVTAPITPQPSEPAPNPNEPLKSPDAVFNPPSTPDASQQPLPSLSAGQGSLTAQNFIPGMIGDAFAGNAIVLSNFESHQTGSSPYFTVTSPGFGGNVGTVKLVESGSPIPRDRVLVNYSYFGGVPLSAGATSINRVTPGFEKTLFGGLASIEFRVPMAVTQGPFDMKTSMSSDNVFQYGNISVFAKSLIYRDAVFALSTGLGISVPTGSNAVVQSTTQISAAPLQPYTSLLIKNQSTHLMPFIGTTFTPNDRWFSQSIMQLDVASRGNDVYIEGQSGGPLHSVGSLNDSTFLYASASTGYWLVRDTSGQSRLTGFAPIAEVHLNQSLQHPDTVTVPNSPNLFPLSFGNQIGGGPSSTTVVNAVVGATVLIDDDKSLTVGYTTPLGSGLNKQFDGEFRLFFNWYFGAPLNRMTSIQF